MRGCTFECFCISRNHYIGVLRIYSLSFLHKCIHLIIIHIYSSIQSLIICRVHSINKCVEYTIEDIVFEVHRWQVFINVCTYRHIHLHTQAHTRTTNTHILIRSQRHTYAETNARKCICIYIQVYNFVYVLLYVHDIIHVS